MFIYVNAMKQSFYINDKLKDLISNLIYEIQNYNCIISKYMNLENYDEEYKNIVKRQSFFIDRTMEALNDFNDINSKSFKLNMNFENIDNIINNAIDNFSDIFKSKRVKFTIDNNISDDCTVLMDRSKLVSSLFNILTFIYNVIKVNSSIDILCNFLHYDNEDFLIMNDSINNEGSESIKKYIDISIIFECDSIPREIKRKFFKTPLISYENSTFNNLYLYTAYNIIKLHSGNIWFEVLDNKERINIIFPAKNKL